MEAGLAHFNYDISPLRRAESPYRPLEVPDFFAAQPCSQHVKIGRRGFCVDTFLNSAQSTWLEMEIQREHEA